jgi:hypothetical protein
VQRLKEKLKDLEAKEAETGGFQWTYVPGYSRGGKQIAGHRRAMGPRQSDKLRRKLARWQRMVSKQKPPITNQRLADIQSTRIGGGKWAHRTRVTPLLSLLKTERAYFLQTLRESLATEGQKALDSITR